jgi:hypothetical protein
MSDKPKKRPRRWTWRIAALLALYVLSIGPAFRWADGAVLFVYAPVLWLGNACYPFGIVLGLYMILWMPQDALRHIIG